MGPIIVQRGLVTGVLLCLIAATFSCGDGGFILEGIPKADFDGSTGSSVVEAAPDGASPLIDSEQAVAKAKDGHYRDGSVRQVVLVWLTERAPDPPREYLAWAVNFDPESLAPTIVGCRTDCGDYELEYAVVFVDAMTGEGISSAESSRPTGD